MSVLQAIQAWGATLPDWQQDAIGRLYKGPLTAADEDEIYALLKGAHGAPTPKDLAAKILVNNVFVAPTDSGKTVQVLAIRDLRFVNALAADQRLPIAPKGVTAIYGENGVGKSGYSRAIKKACRARNQSEPILPDTRLPPGKAGKAQATFEVSVDGAQPIAVTWTDGTPGPPELSAIAIFDAHCARDYLDQHGDFSYAPYGMDILRDLASLCTKLRAKVDLEASQTKPNVAPFAQLAEGQTAVANLLKNLSAKTKPGDVTSKATVSSEELEQHAQWAKSLKDNNPEEKASQFRQRAERMDGLAQRCEEKSAIVSDAAVLSLKGQIEVSNSAKAAAALAATTFKQMPGQLPGTGGEAWQKLFEAARAFTLESHPCYIFPELGPNAQCPLCQQPLQDGAARLLAFDTFINNETETAARSARAFAAASYKAIVEAELSVGLDKALQDELEQIAPDLATICKEFSKCLPPRALSVKSAAGPNGDWTAVKPLAISPVAELRALTKKLLEEATTLDQAADGKARAELETKFNELDARVKLGPHEDAVLDAIAKYVRQGILAKCGIALRTNAISNKASDLTDQVISKDLESALNQEFVALDAGGLNVALKSQTAKGKTSFKLAVQHPGDPRPISVLSEGEQRAIAIGSFLAEVNISGMKGGIFFDDPVSSLDHRRRWIVARRLVEEGAKRQVIILTHDIYFLCALQQEAEEQQAAINCLALNRSSKGCGVASDRIPFDGTTSTKRVGILRNLHTECNKLYKAGDEEQASEIIRKAYGQLRSTWERAIEEVLFGGVVTRFTEGVQTLKLIEVEIHDSDWIAVNAGMSKASKYVHDGAAMAQLPTPTPAELSTDIESFEAWRKEVDARRLETRKRRK